MSYQINETHDPNLRSWVESANDPNTDFPIQNLPLGLFDRPDSGFKRRVGVAIGNQVLDLLACCEAGLLSLKENVSWFFMGNLNLLMEIERPIALNLRRQIMELLREGNTKIQDYQKEHPESYSLLVPMSEIALRQPVSIGDYTDFYASVYHATRAFAKSFSPRNS